MAGIVFVTFCWGGGGGGVTNFSAEGLESKDASHESTILKQKL